MVGRERCVALGRTQNGKRNKDDKGTEDLWSWKNRAWWPIRNTVISIILLLLHFLTEDYPAMDAGSRTEASVMGCMIFQRANFR